MRRPVCLSSRAWRAGFVVVAAFFGCCVGCEYNVYELELQPVESGINRKLTVWRTSGSNKIVDMSEAELQQIASLYDSQTVAPFNRRHTFESKFAGVLPQDIGGAGYYTRNQTPFGDEFIYQERFQGSLDAVAVLARRQAAADELTDHFIGWFEQELGNEPGFPRLRQFLDKEFREDVKNIGLQFWLAGLTAEDSMGVAQYLVERGYGSPTEVQLILSNDNESQAQVLRLVKGFLARKLGLSDDAPLPDSLNVFASAESMQQSLERYLRTTPAFAALREKWEREKPTNPDAPEPNPADVLSEVAGRALFNGPKLRASDELNVTLKTGVKPLHTNGDWRESDGEVVWSEHMNGSEGPSVFCYAQWSQPNRDAQRERFGRVLLEGESLAKYANWYSLLSPEHRQEWEQFIATLKPGLGLAERIGGFRFASDPPDDRSDQPPASAADTARELLLKQLMPRI